MKKLVITLANKQNTVVTYNDTEWNWTTNTTSIYVSKRDEDDLIYYPWANVLSARIYDVPENGNC